MHEFQHGATITEHEGRMIRQEMMNRRLNPRTGMLLWTVMLALVLATAGCGDDNTDDLFGNNGSGSGGGGTAGSRLTVIVAVIDSLMPEEIGASLTPAPTLVGLRDNGTFYTESRSVFSAETIPNHVAMMTGVYPGTNGIPTNTYWNRQGEVVDRDLSLPTEVEVENLFTRIKNECPNIKTAAMMSKDYLYEVFSACGFSAEDCGRNVEPDIHFDPVADPTFLPSPAGLTPDLTTMGAALAALPEVDFMFINLGQVDRSGHADETGVLGVPLFRNAILLDTDTRIAMLIDELKAQGRWENTVLFIVSDHGMDWSQPFDFINAQATLDGVGGLAAIQSGGTDSVFLTNQSERGTTAGNQRLKQARDALLQESGVADVWYTFPNPEDPGDEKVLSSVFNSAHENIGDMVLSAEDNFRFSDPGPQDNPIPGNHGHEVTLHNTFLIGGGAGFIKAQTISELDEPVSHLERRSGQSENVDVAPTVAWLFGMSQAGFEGRVLNEAFSTAASPSQCGALP